MIGLAWTTHNPLSARAHSTSTGSPYSFSIASPTRASSPAWPGDSTGVERRPAGVSVSIVPAPSATVITSLPPSW